MAHDVFISHSSQDKPVADAVCAVLENAAIRCWIAPRDVQPGRSFAGEINRGIHHSKVMVLIFSAHSNASEQVLREVQLAANSHLHIVQFRIQDVLPNEDLEYYLSAPHWLDALAPPLENHLGRLQDSVKALLQLGAPEPPKSAAAGTVGSSSERSDQASSATAPESTAPARITQPIKSEFAISSDTSVSEKPGGKQLFKTKPVVWLTMAATVFFLAGAIILFFALCKRAQNPATSVALAQPSPSTESATTVSTVRAASSVKPAPTVQASRPASSAIESSGEVGRNPSFAFVDMNRIFKEYGETKQAEAKINQARSAAKIEYDTRAKAYQTKLDLLNAMEAGSARDHVAHELKAMEKELNQFRTDREKQLQDQASKLRGENLRKIKAKIDALNSSDNNLILDKNGLSLNGVPFVLFSDPNADMSARVISALNDNATVEFVATRGVFIALVDMDEIFKRYNKTKTAELKANEARNASKKEYDARADVYKSKLNSFNALPAGSSKDRVASELQVMEKEIDDFRTAREKQLQDEAFQRRKEIVKDIEDYIAQHYIKNEKYMIFDSSAQTLSGNRWLVFSRGIPDLTAEVVSGLNYGKGGVPSSFISTEKLRFARVDLGRAYAGLPERQSVEAEIKAAKDKATAELGDHPDAAARAAKDKELETFTANKYGPLLEKINTAVSVIGKRNGFHIIYNTVGHGSNSSLVVITSNGIPDLTTDVITDLGGTE